MSPNHRSHPYGRSATDVRRRSLRAKRLRRMRITQLLALAALVLLVALAGLGAWRVLQAPSGSGDAAGTASDNGSASAPAGSAAACPEPGALPADPASVTVLVLNGTSQAGLAGEVTRDLENRGFQTETADNTSLPPAPVTIVHGPSDYLAATAVAAQFDGAVLEEDAEASGTVQVLIGEDFPGVRDQDAAAAALQEPVAMPAGCAG